MSTKETSTKSIGTPTGATVRRLRAVAAGVLAAVVGWLLIEVVAGFELQSPIFGGATTGQDIGLREVVFISLIASLAAWGLLALFEARLPHPRRVWTFVVLAGLAISLGGPLSGTGIDATGRSLLILLHLIVAAVLIPLLYRTALEDRA